MREWTFDREWRLAQMLHEPQVAFVLWAVYSGLYRHSDEFEHEFGPALQARSLIDTLKQNQLLEERDDGLSVTEDGREIALSIDTFAKVESPPQLTAENRRVVEGSRSRSSPSHEQKQSKPTTLILGRVVGSLDSRIIVQIPSSPQDRKEIRRDLLQRRLTGLTASNKGKPRNGGTGKFRRGGKTYVTVWNVEGKARVGDMVHVKRVGNQGWRLHDIVDSSRADRPKTLA